MGHVPRGHWIGGGDAADPGRPERRATTREPGDLPPRTRTNPGRAGRTGGGSRHDVASPCLHGDAAQRAARRPLLGSARRGPAMSGPLIDPSRPIRPAGSLPAKDPRAEDPPAEDPLAADDPHGAVRAALAAPLGGAPAAAEILLAWLLGLADGLDPALAAARIVGAVDRATIRNDRLLGLLAEVAAWPSCRLSPLRHGRRTLRDLARRIGPNMC